MAYEAYGAEAAVEAVREFLEDGTHGGATSPADTLNDVLAARRTTLGITSATLPDISIVEEWWPSSAAVMRTPHLLIEWDAVADEKLPPTGRSYDHGITLWILATDTELSGPESAVPLALARYADALRVLFHRRTSGEQGATLNNGGTGAAQGRVIHAAVESQSNERFGNPATLVLRTRLRVRMNEAF